MSLIRKMDAFYEKHPTISFGIAILCVFAVLYIAADWDKQQDTALRIQMMSTNLRSST